MASRRLVATMMSRFSRATVSRTRSLPLAAASSTIAFNAPKGESFRAASSLAKTVQLFFDLRDPANKPQSHRVGIAPLHRFGTSSPTRRESSGAAPRRPTRRPGWPRP